MRILHVPYPTWSGVVGNNNFDVYHSIEGTSFRNSWAGNRDFIYTTVIDETTFSDFYETDYESIATTVSGQDDAIARIVGLSKVPNTYSSSGKNIVSMFPTEGVRTTIVTHNWADKTTWYQKSTRVVQEVPTTTVSGTTYTLNNPYVIDTFHGRIWDEDDLRDASNNSYRVVVEADVGAGWVTKTEKDPHTNVGDYTVTYASGIVNFSPAIAEDAQVRVTYYYAGSSEFTIKPDTGKVLQIRNVEVQFSQDVELNDTVDFIAYGYVDFFAPHLVPYLGAGTKIPLGTTRYKTMYDFQAEANGGMPVIPAIGGPSWRGIQNPIIVFPWNYAALMNLYSSSGMEIRIKLQHDVPFDGEFGTATLYCLSEDE